MDNMMVNPNFIKHQMTKFDHLLQGKGTQALGQEDKSYIVAREFESLFVKQLLDGFDDTVDRGQDPLYGGQSEDLYRNLFNEELSKIISTAGGIGLTDMIVSELDDESKGKG